MTSAQQIELEARCQILRWQLQLQRQRIAGRLAAAGQQDHYPRSMTLRVLLHRPELLARLAGLLAGARLAGAVSAILIVASFMRLAVTIREVGQRRDETGPGP